MTDKDEDLTVSLEPHLLETLRNVHSRLPTPLADKLVPYAFSPSSSENKSSTSKIPTIPYQILLTLSQWARSPAGSSSLKDPPAPDMPALDPADYTMISLLAGTTTSPNRRFPVQSPPSDGPEDARRELNDRRTIVAVINALLSVGGTGGAVWWAAGSIGWRDEWVRVFYAIIGLACPVR